MSDTLEAPSRPESETTPYASKGPVHTVESAAERYQMHPKTITSALRSGDLKGYQRVTGGKWRMFEADLDAWISRPRPARRRKKANA